MEEERRSSSSVSQVLALTACLDGGDAETLWLFRVA